LREALKRAEAEDEQLEKEIELLKRKALRESEQLKWEALREYGEKLVLLSQAASPIIKVLPTIPPTPASPYNGRDTTGAVRASLQRALDNYKTGQIHLPPQPAPGDLSRSDTQSFGESHASELSSIYTEPSTPAAPLNVPKTEEENTSVINPQVLNQSPAPIPADAAPGPASNSGVAKVEPSNLPATPTIVETGIPVSAGPGGPGPRSGSLHDVKGASSTPASAPTHAGPAVGATPKHETAEEEKKRLAALYSPPVQSTPPVNTAAPPTSSPALPTSSTPATSNTGQQQQRYESAEEEKKRLEREERERLLRGNNASNVPPKDAEPKDEEELPPYQEPGI
jgi:hypothetical protein